MKEWELVKETWLHRVNPSLKLGMSLLLCIAVMFVRNLEGMAAIGSGLLFLFLLFTGQPLKRILLLLIPFCAIFVSTASAMIMFGKGETLWFEWGLIRITEESFLRGMLIGLRAMEFAVLGLTFALTTRPVNLFYSLMQQLRLDPKYAYSFMGRAAADPDHDGRVRNDPQCPQSARQRKGDGVAGYPLQDEGLHDSVVVRQHPAGASHRRGDGSENGFPVMTAGPTIMKSAISSNDILFLAYMLLLAVVAYGVNGLFGN